jgi:hypothetical protein
MGIYAYCKRMSVAELHAMQQCQDEETLVNLLYGGADWPEYTWSDKCYVAVNEILNDERAQGQPYILDILQDGSAIGSYWIGYGPLRYLLPVELRQIVEQLRLAGWRRTLDELTHSGDEVEFYEPDYGSAEPGRDEECPFADEDRTARPSDDSIAFVAESCKRLVLLLGAAAQAGDAVLLWLS